MKVVSNCCQCAMLDVCYGKRVPLREAGREKAALCHKPGKGRTTDVLRVIGRDRGMSRKKAVRLLADGKMCFVDDSTVESV